MHNNDEVYLAHCYQYTYFEALNSYKDSISKSRKIEYEKLLYVKLKQKMTAKGPLFLNSAIDQRK